jgi:phosphate transport system permease protein
VAVLPYAGRGIIGAFTLGLGKAIGETLAITMVIGNRPDISWSLFAPAHTMTSVIINEFSEAVEPLHSAALIHVALLLFLVTLITNILARLMIYQIGWKKNKWND